jgi:exopolysaccharide biosynthesis protein
LLITIDGRNEEAQGMTLYELSRLMKALKCEDAINLDGGGSTTMWIAKKGVVNHPSDNKIFDAQGERNIANVLLVH